MSFNVRLFGYSGIIQVGQSHAQQYSGDAVFLNEEPCLWSQILVCDGSTIATSVRITTVPDGTQMVCVEVPDGHEIRYEVVQPGAAERTVSDSSRRGSGSFNLAWSAGYTLSIFGATADAPAVTYVTWDAVTAAFVTLTNGNLTATGTGPAGVFPHDQGTQVAPVAAKGSGKFYIEFTYNNDISTGSGFGVWNRSTSYSLLDTAGFGGVIATPRFGRIFSEGSIIGFMNSVVPTDVIGVAIDLDNYKVWFKNVAGPNSPSDWNTDALANPVTNVGGLVIPAGSAVPVACFDGTGTGVAGEQWTANFGASAFLGAVPSGYTSGWTA